MRPPPIIVVGAGIAGLAAAIDLARRGAAVTVVERAASSGGKIRQISVDGAGIDAGPTVFTMRWILEGLFSDAGARLQDHLELQAAETLARHAWSDGGRLDLHASIERSAASIAEFASEADAANYRDFCARSARVFATLRDSFIADQRPSPLQLVRRVGWSRLGALWETAPFRTLWQSLAQQFRDPRLRQLFGRYATYCGSSPMQAPATLMLVAHVEQDGVWLVNGGMRQVAIALQSLAESLGVQFRFGSHVQEILTDGSRVSGVTLGDGDSISSASVVFAGDVAALGAGLLGPHAARVTEATAPGARSLSAVTWCTTARPSGFELAHHNVFFGDDYTDEFDAIFRRREICGSPTVYLCAQDRSDTRAPSTGQRERLLMLINAPADGDRAPLSLTDLDRHAEAATRVLARCGLQLQERSTSEVVTTPQGFNELFPGTGGALYGSANHGAMTTFKRLGARSRLRGLYLAGGSVHPGPGVPMAAMSGRLAARACLEDLGDA